MARRRLPRRPALEAPEPHVPLVPYASSSALTDPLAERRRAAWTGAFVAGVPALAVLATARAGLNAALPTLGEAFAALVPTPLLPFALGSFLFLLPALLALPAGAAGAMVARKKGQRDRDLGLAAAAGAGMGTTALTAGALLFEGLAHGEMLLLPIWALAAALGVGVVGAASFAAVPRDRSSEAPPSLYAGLVSAGLGAPALLAGGGVWAAIAWMFPFLSPWALAKLAFSGSVASAVATAIAVAGVAPISFLTARAMRRTSPKAHGGALAAGLLAPTVVPFVGYLGVLMFYTYSSVWGPAAAIGIGGAVAVAAHALAILAGLASETSDSTPRLEA